jgi:hypothetical protein
VDPGACPADDRCGDGLDNDCDGQIDEQADASGKDVCGDDEDNDCDGQIDEGHDADGDGNTWCGDSTVPGGAAGDCDDTSPDVFFGASERCDGVDNDCDGNTDESSSNKALCGAQEECIGRCVTPSCAIDGSVECEGNEMCDIETGQCVPRTCDETQCAPGEFCDSVSGQCTSQKRPNGDPCGSHEECASGSCIESAALRLSVRAERVCGKTCCSDAQCGPLETCFSPGSGARSCLPKSMISVSADATITCTEDDQCGTGRACGVETGLTIAGPNIETRTNVTAAVCRMPTGDEVRVGDSCGFDESVCRAQACVAVSFGFFSTFVCSSTCGSSDDCGPLSEAVGSVGRTYCRFVGTGTLSSGDEDFVPICVVARSGSETGSGGAGAPCRSGSECLDGACVGVGSGGQGICAPTCCNDSQCPSANDRPTRCRPVAFGQHYETRCVP